MLMTGLYSLGLMVVLLLGFTWLYSRYMLFGKYAYSRKVYILTFVGGVLVYRIAFMYLMPTAERVSGITEYSTYRVLSHEVIDNYTDSYVKVNTEVGDYKLPIQGNYKKFNHIKVNYISVPTGKKYKYRLNVETKSSYEKHLRVVPYYRYVKLSSDKPVWK